MKQSTRKILAICVVLTMVSTSMLFSFGSIIGSPAQSSRASSMSSFTLPAGYGQPIFVAVDTNGKIWFTMPVTNAIGRYDPVASTVTQWAVPTPGAGPWGIAINASGTIWFTEHYVNHIGSFDPNSQTFHEIATPASNSNPYGITVDSSSNIWFTENTDSVALLGEYTNKGVLNEFKIRNTSTGGTGLTVLQYLDICGQATKMIGSYFSESSFTTSVDAASAALSVGVTFRETPGSS